MAVNLAVLAPLRADFWCVLDHPMKMAEVYTTMSPGERKRLPVLWCCKQQAENWHQLHIRCLPFADTEEAFRAQNLPGASGVRCAMLGRTITAAISRCIGFGADAVDVFGCDMAGHAHAFGRDPENRADEVWDQRWKDERGIFESAMGVWNRMGVPVRLHQPPS